MEDHVFTVWDFVLLLKVRRRWRSCAKAPWVPQGESAVRALINQIVLGLKNNRSFDRSKH